MSEEWGRKEGGLRPGIPEDGSAQQTTALAFYRTSGVILKQFKSNY